MPQLVFADWAPQLVWLAISFIGLYFILSRIALPRIGEVLEERSDHIQRDVDQTAKLKTETETAIANYEQQLQSARANALEIAQKARDKLTQEMNVERAEIEKQIQTKALAAEASIRAAKTDALAQVNDIAADTASNIIEKLIGVKATGDELSASLGKN